MGLTKVLNDVSYEFLKSQDGSDALAYTHG